MNKIAMMDELREAVSRRLPVTSPEEQRAGIVLLRELAKGEPVAISQLAEALGTSVEAAEALVRDSALSPFIHTDERDRIQGFWGLSVIPTHHQLTINGRTLWAWCAADSFEHPELLGGPAAIESRDPETDELLRLTVSATRIEAAEPKGIVVSMVRPQTWDVTSAARIMASACHFIFFFASHASGKRWQEKHPETVLLSLDEAFALAKRSNTHVFGAEVARLRAQAA